MDAFRHTDNVSNMHICDVFLYPLASNLLITSIITMIQSTHNIQHHTQLHTSAFVYVRFQWALVMVQRIWSNWVLLLN